MFPPRLPTLPATAGSRVFIRPMNQRRLTARDKRRKRRGSAWLLRSEIRWALFVVFHQVSAQLYAIIGVPEPQDQLTI